MEIPDLSKIISVQVTLTRPADTTAYAALDAISDSTSAPTVVFTFTNLIRLPGGSGYITKARLRSNNKLNTGLQFKLHLFSSAPTAINDNSPYLLLDANAAISLGTINFPATWTEDTTNSTGVASVGVIGDGSSNIPLPIVAGSASRIIYGLLETLTAFTPISGQTFFIELTLDSN